MTRDKTEMKRYSKYTSKKIISILVTLLALFILFALFVVPNLGKWLVVNDEVKESDIIVVLMGSVYDRILEATDLYDEGYSDKIVLINSYIAARDITINRGIKVYGNALINKMAAMDLGIPEEDILVLEGSARSTQDEAIVIREYLRNQSEIESVLLVTSKYHSKRAKKIFEKALNILDREINIYLSPSKYDLFNANQWWKEREDIKQVVLEYIKLVYFHFREQFLLNK